MNVGWVKLGNWCVSLSLRQQLQLERGNLKNKLNHNHINARSRFQFECLGLKKKRERSTPASLRCCAYSCSGHRHRCFPPALRSRWTWPAFRSDGTRPERPTPCYYCDSAQGTPGTDPRKAPQCWSDDCRPDTSPASQTGENRNVSVVPGDGWNTIIHI